ncbi:MAG: DNA starvation/stationary phase protection protein, partial [Micrococcaceae bacterium]|nr:DNA starvation/stationary phase protection protein [Micrococcaceae bacterium]
RQAIGSGGALDPIPEDLLIGQVGELELFQWFLRSHVENSDGDLADAGARTEKGAAAKAKGSSKK